MTVAAIVLAAGRGTRFGESPKLLAELEGKPLVRHPVEAALGAGLPTLVVVGHREPEIRAALADLPVAFVPNAAYADGLATSVKAGFAALPPDIRAAIVLLGDMPRVTPGLLTALCAAFATDPGVAAVIPVADGRRGNPVLLSRSLAPEIATLAGDAGAGPLLRGRSDVIEVAVAGEAATVDVDTPEMLSRLQACPNTTPSSTAE